MNRASESFRATDFSPEGFQVSRDLSLGRHPLLDAFPRLDALPLARQLVRDRTARERLFAETFIELVDQDLWMYVAPKEMPKVFRRRWKPVVSPATDCIVIGAGHLRESPPLTLFMDIYHELCHVLQRQGGADLWPPGVSYVERWTEIEAYRFVVDEARKLGVPDSFLRDYLRVEWISDEEFRTLLEALHVAADG
ncbi:MAG TPA: hypothetical protein VEK13_07540 [Thermoplasmata archaeon]|nr:hypothetical protein [Thermoplasmata archaeon]